MITALITMMTMITAQDSPAAMVVSLDDAMRQAVRHNRTLKRYLAGYMSSRRLYEAASGRWNPVAGATVDYQKARYPAVQGQPFQTTSNAVAVGSVFLMKPLPTGGKVTLSAGLTHSEQTMRLQFSDSVPPSNKDIDSYKAMVNITVEHPLLAGMSIKVSRVEIEKARLKMMADRFIYLSQAEATLRDVMKAYWSLVLAWKAWEIQKVSLGVLKSQEKLTDSLVDSGKVAAVNLLAVQSEIAKREGEVRRAWSAVVAASLNIKDAMGMDVTARPQAMRPSTEPGDQGYRPPKDLLARVLRRSNQVKALVAQMKSMRQDILKASNALLPSLDVKFRIGPAMTSNDMTEAIKGVGTKMDEAYEIEAGATFTKVLGRAPRARYEALRYARQTLKIQLKSTRSRLIVATLIALDSLEASRFRMEAAQKAITLAQTHLDAECKRFAQGLSTNHSILLRLQELEVARFQLLQAAVELAKTVADIKTLAGTLLASYQIRVPGN